MEEAASTSASSEDIRRHQKVVVHDEADDDIIYAFKRYVHVKKDRKARQKAWNYESNEVDNGDVKGDRLHAVSEEIREAAARDRARNRIRGGGSVTYSEPLVTQTDGRLISAKTAKDKPHRSRDPQKGVYDHPFYRDHKKRSASETNLLKSTSRLNERPAERRESASRTGRKKSLRPTSTKGHQPTELPPTASLTGQSLAKYKKKPSEKGQKQLNLREKSASKKDDSGFMLIGGGYTM